jgi:hypothetical protein
MLVHIAVLVIVFFFLLPVPPLAQTSGEVLNAAELFVTGTVYAHVILLLLSLLQDMILVLGWFLVFLAACVILASFFKVLQDSWSEVKKKEEFHQQLAEEMQRMKMLEKLMRDAAADQAAPQHSRDQNQISRLHAQVITASSRPHPNSFSA